MKNWYLPLLSSLLLGAAFLNYHLGFLVTIGLIPLLLFIEQNARHRKFCLPVWLAGFLFYAIATIWIGLIDPSVLQGFSHQTGVFLTIVSWVLSVIIFSLSWLVWAVVIKKFGYGGSLQRISTIFVLPAVWVMAEYARSWLFSIIFAAPQATLGAHWNFGNLGLGLITTPLAPISRSIGLFGLCYAVVAINIALLWLWQKHWLRTGIFTVVLLGAWLVNSWPIYQPSQVRTLNVGFIQTPAKATSTVSLPQFLDTINQNSHAPLDILVLPEYADYVTLMPTETKQALLIAIFQNRLGAIVYGSSGAGTNAYIEPATPGSNNIIVANQDGQIISSQPKSFLIPGGEYMPNIGKWVIGLLHQGQALPAFERARQLPKANPPRPVAYNGNTIGALACSGIVSPAFYRQLANQGSTILTNSASLTTFNKTPFYHEQAKAMARFQAVANNQPFVQAAEGGRSYIIDRDGHFATATTNGDFAYRSTPVTIGGSKTLYSRFGEYTVLLSFLTVTSFAIWIKFRRVN